jgi:ABC-type sulfate transport system permease component
MFAAASKRVLPGFTLSLGTSLLFVCLILLPLSALVMQLAQMSWAQYWDVVTNPQVVAAYKVTLLSAFVASIFNGVFGLLMAWILNPLSLSGPHAAGCADGSAVCAADGGCRSDPGVAVFRERLLRRVAGEV